MKVACGLFRRYLVAEAKMIKMLEADGASCGAGPQVVQQVRGSHAKAQQIGKQVCDAATTVVDPPVMDDMLIPPKPMPWTEPWPTRLSERQSARQSVVNCRKQRLPAAANINSVETPVIALLKSLLI